MLLGSGRPRPCPGVDPTSSVPPGATRCPPRSRSPPSEHDVPPRGGGSLLAHHGRQVEVADLHLGQHSCDAFVSGTKCAGRSNRRTAPLVMDAAQQVPGIGHAGVSSIVGSRTGGRLRPASTALPIASPTVAVAGMVTMFGGDHDLPRHGVARFGHGENASHGHQHRDHGGEATDVTPRRRPAPLRDLWPYRGGSSVGYQGVLSAEGSLVH